MTIKPPPSHFQPDLISVIPDKPLGKSGESRTRYGQVVEQIVCGLLDVTRIPNSGSYDAVFDAHHKSSDSFIEIKSLRRNNKLPIYEWRRAKDLACDRKLLYAIGIHRCSNVPDLKSVWACMANTLDTILVLPAWWIYLESRKYPVRHVPSRTAGSRNGCERKSYCDGYRSIPHDSLLAASCFVPHPSEIDLHGLNFRADIRFHRSLDPWR